MARLISTDLGNILADPARKMDWTVDITLPNATVYRYATAPLTISGHTYTNDMETVREIRQALGGPIDKTNIGLQNKDSVIGDLIAAAPDQWRRAEVIVGRYYRSADGSVHAWISMFTGAFQQPTVEDLKVTTDVVSDVASAGLIICTRTLAPACPSHYKHPRTCGSTSIETTCNHHLRSKGGCDGRNNSHRFAGYEHRYQITTTAPGGAGNGDLGVLENCPRVDQWIPVEIDGERLFQRAGKTLKGDKLINPLTGEVDLVKSATIVPDQEIWQVNTAEGISGFSSFSHPVFPYREHLDGIRVSHIERDSPALLWERQSGKLIDDRFTFSEPTGELGDVVLIEMESGHRYSYGDDIYTFIVCHNSIKPGPGDYIVPPER